MPQVADSAPLRERAFDACPCRVHFLELLRSLVLPGGLERFMLGACAHGQHPRLARRMSALVAHRAGCAIRACEAHMHDGMTMPILARDPEHAFASLRAGGDVAVPVNHKGRHIKALVGFGLPAGVGGHRPDERDVVALLAGNQMISAHITRIYNAFARQQLPRGQSRLDRRRQVKIRGRGGRRLDIGNKMRCLVLTGFREMHFVARPIDSIKVYSVPCPKANPARKGDAYATL
jgi:hypothetical protein